MNADFLPFLAAWLESAGFQRRIRPGVEMDNALKRVGRWKKISCNGITACGECSMDYGVDAKFTRLLKK
jgi:hypothetical protein